MLRNAVRIVGRAALAAIFIDSGRRIASNPHPVQAKAVAKAMPSLPQPELVTRIHGAMMAAGGTALALDLRSDIAASVLAATMVPNTYIGHPYWTVADPAARAGQRVHFLKNVGIFGGLLLVAVAQRERKSA